MLAVLVLFADLVALRTDIGRVTEMGDLVMAEMSGLRLVDARGKTLWQQKQTRLPALYAVEPAALEAYRKDTRLSIDKLTTFFSPPLFRDKEIVAVIGRDFCVLARSDGHELFDAEVSHAGTAMVGFDDAELRINVAGRDCRAHVGKSAQLIPCGDRVIYWWSTGVRTYKTAPWADDKQALFTADVAQKGGKIEIGDVTLDVKPIK